MPTYDITKKGRVVNPNASFDALYGIYVSIEEALESTAGLREPGRTVGIISNPQYDADGFIISGEVKEYWFKSGIEDADLVVKDRLENYVPLVGTDLDNPVTGDIEIYGGNDNRLFSSYGGYTNSINFTLNNIFLRTTDGENYTDLSVQTDRVVLYSDEPTSIGLKGAQDFSGNNNGTDRKIYPQTGWVQDAISEATTSLSDTLNAATTRKFEYIATGGETNFTDISLINKIIIGVFRLQPYKVISTGTPANQQVLYNSTTGSFSFKSDNPLAAGEYILIIYQQINSEAIESSVVRRTLASYAAMVALLPTDNPIIVVEYTILSDETNGATLSHYTHYNNNLTFFVEGDVN